MPLDLEIDGSNALNIKDNGNVGIGTSNPPQNYKYRDINGCR